MSYYGRLNTTPEKEAARAAYRARVRAWTEHTQGHIIQEFGRLNIGKTDRGLASLHYKINQRNGEPVRIAYKFQRYLIFVHKGVGGVYTVQPKGSGNVIRKTEGPFNRKPKPLFDAIPWNMEQLEDIATQYYANEAQLTSTVMLRS